VFRVEVKMYSLVCAKSWFIPAIACLYNFVYIRIDDLATDI